MLPSTGPPPLSSRRHATRCHAVYIRAYTRPVCSTVADLERYKKKNFSSPPKIRENRMVFSLRTLSLFERLFYGTLRQLPWEEFDRFVRTANTEFPNVRLRFDFWGGWVGGRATRRQREGMINEIRYGCLVAPVNWIFFFFFGFYKDAKSVFFHRFLPMETKDFCSFNAVRFFFFPHPPIDKYRDKYFWPRDKKFENFSNLSISIKLLIFGIIERSRKEYLESEVIRAKAFKKCSHVWAR